MPTAVALIPARAGSKRVPGKNIRELGGHPLLAYTIVAARDSGVFDAVIVSTDSSEIAAIAERYGAEVPGLRPAEMATATSPDIEWVRHTIAELAADGRRYEIFSLLRPTSPFRGGEAIRRAFEALVALGDRADSLRAVRLCKEHPGKMWVIEGELMRPLLPQPEGVPYHSRQYASLPTVHVQDSSIEIAWTRAVEAHDSIAGERVAPFFTEDLEGFSIDYPDDWRQAEEIIAANPDLLPAVPAAAEVE
jgi:CMP-N,N'-diacetyllegionaminic acid synthase